MQDPEAFKQQQKEFWADFGDTYNEVVIGTRLPGEAYDRATSELVARFGQDAAIKILDLAAAGGEPSLTIAKAMPNATIVCTDLVMDVPKSEARAASQGVAAGRIKFEQADAEMLASYTDGSFDAVVCVFGLMFMPHVDKALREAARVLRTGGVYIAAVWGPQHEVPFFTYDGAVAMSLKPDAPPRPHLASRLGAPEELQKLVAQAKEAGLADAATTPFEISTAFASIDVLATMTMRAPGALKQLMADRAEQGNPVTMDEVKAVLQPLLDGKVGEDGRVVVPGNKVLLLTGTKQG